MNNNEISKILDGLQHGIDNARARLSLSDDRNSGLDVSASTSGVQRSDQFSPGPSTSGVRRSDQFSPGPSTSGVRRSDQFSLGPSTSGVQRSDQFSPGPSTSGVRRSDQFSPGPSTSNLHRNDNLSLGPSSSRVRRSDQLSPGPSTSKLKRNGNLSLGPSNERQDNVNREMRGLFPQLSGKARQHLKNKKPKEQFIKETFTREYCCLVGTDSVTTPSLEQMKLLNEAGLGKKKITFDVKDEHADFVSKLESYYPRLKSCGGFTLWKATTGGYSRLITKIDLHFYDVKKLRLRYICGSGILYIKPLQRNLDLSPMVDPEVNQNDQEDVSDLEAPFVECIKCSEVININEFEEHRTSCESRYSSAPTKPYQEMPRSEMAVHEKVAKLKTMFPAKTEDMLEASLNQNHDDLDETIDDLLFSTSVFKKTFFDDLKELQEHLAEKLTGPTCRLEVDSADIYQDMVGFYKSGRFSPDCHLKIILVVCCGSVLPKPLTCFWKSGSYHANQVLFYQLTKLMYTSRNCLSSSVK